MIDYASRSNVTGTFPNVVANNASGAGATDGTAFTAEHIDDMWGARQALLDLAGLTPNGVQEAAGTSQFLDALFRIGSPGTIVMYDKNADPAVIGDRVLLLTGQGILRANYAELDAAVYVGDGNNAAVAAGGGAYYRADDAAGTTPNIAGIYLILPDYRGRVPRGWDSGAIVDPQGASRFLGDNQADAMQRITGEFVLERAGLDSTNGVFTQSSDEAVSATGSSFNTALTGFFNSANSTSPNAAKTDDFETRMANTQTKFGIYY